MTKFGINTKKIALSSVNVVYKTEGFVASTRKILAVDDFISRVAEGVLSARMDLPEGCYSAQTEDGRYTVYFCRKRVLYDQNGMIFYKFLNARGDKGGVDRQLKEYLSENDTQQIILRAADDAADEDDLLRLYLVTGNDSNLNFPRLNENQLKIVETEDSNMLVRGVAGSGKTNVCIEKIVYCACRNYRGKVLYTTFSRGLLNETRDKVRSFLQTIRDFTTSYEQGNVLFLDDDHKRAVENKLGIPFSVDDDGKIVTELKRVAEFLENKVDYLLIEDIYARYFERQRAVGESVFLEEYIRNQKSFRLSGALEKIKNISPEIIYKEIYGMIYGKYEFESPQEMMSKDEYIEARRDSFTPRECEIIYSIALDYAEFSKKRGYVDNNYMSRRIMDFIAEPTYSVGVIDEVQDFTQVNLCLIKKLCRKMFCVGDALQMINPSYFNFGYLKRLMYGDVTGVSELKHNYRSTQRIERIAEKLGEMNISRFGTHSFVLKGESVPSPLTSEAVFVKDNGFISALGDKSFENLTVIVGSQSKKAILKKTLGKIEILTVAEAKGLERDVVVLADVLSDNAEKWRYLQQMSLNRKTADENSVFRYYFNLFYVGVSRARQHLFVAESDHPKFFDKLFDECFERKSKERALASLREIAGALDINDDEFIDRIEKFCSLEQYGNARLAADRLSTEELRKQKLIYIDIHEKYLRYGDLTNAGVEYWRQGMYFEAREMFEKSGDDKLITLMDACRKGGSGALDCETVRFYPLVADNDMAKNIILETLNNDSKSIAASFEEANARMRRKQ